MYRRPFEDAGEDRRPTLTWPRQIPLDGRAGGRLCRSRCICRLAQPLRDSKAVYQCRAGRDPDGRATGILPHFPNQTEVTVAGSHFIQEDSPAEIAAAIECLAAGVNASDTESRTKKSGF